MLRGKLLIPSLSALVLIFGCDGDTTTTGQTASGSAAATQSGLAFQSPEKIRTSLAVNLDQVTAVANVNNRPFPMEFANGRFLATVPDVPVNSTVSIDLLFSETLPDGRILNLARTDSETITIGDADTMITIPEEDFSYAFDDDGDQISNIAERNDNTDPFTPENAGDRIITVEFILPLRIDAENINITIVTAIIADVPREPDMSPMGTAFTVSAQVSTLNTIDIDMRLNQFFEGQLVLIAQATSTVDAGDQDVTIDLPAGDFTFIDSDGDGIDNIDEIEAGTDPFVAQ